MRRNLFFALSLILKSLVYLTVTSYKLTQDIELKDYSIKVDCSIRCCLECLMYLEKLKDVRNFVLISLEYKEFSAQRPTFLVSFAFIDLAWHIKIVIVHNNA